VDSLLGPAVFAALFVLFLLVRSRSEAPALPAPEPDTSSVQELLLAGRKIDAIKRYRQEHGVGLKEAKQAVEAMAHQARSA